MTKKLLLSVLGLYLVVSALIFAPLYNWRYAKENGFVKWLLLGEVVSTAKSFIWPYYTFFYSTIDNVNIKNDNLIEKNNEERNTIKYIILKSQSEPLTEDDYNKLSYACKKYYNKIGEKEYFQAMADYVKTLDLIFIHAEEVNNCIISSIQQERPVITAELKDIIAELNKIGIINVTLEGDKKLIEDAVNGITHIDEKGNKGDLKKKMELGKKNADGMKKIFFTVSK